MKNRPVGAKLFHEDGQTDMTKRTVTFRNFANAPPKKEDARSSSTQDVPTQSKKLCAARSSTASHRA
jgi:hypothetical protein